MDECVEVCIYFESPYGNRLTADVATNCLARQRIISLGQQVTLCPPPPTAFTQSSVFALLSPQYDIRFCPVKAKKLAHK
jgi:hypothetical protein